MNFLRKIIKWMLGTKEDQALDLSSYLVSGHISKTTGKRYRKK